MVPIKMDGMTQQSLSTSPQSQTGRASGLSADFGQRRFGRVNWLGLRTLYLKEVRRFVKVLFQTVIAPVISTLLFLLVFTQAFGASRPAVGDVAFMVFLAPGLTMMAILTNAFQNSSSSLIIGKVQGSIVDVLMPPLSPAEQAVAFVAGAATRGLLVGFVTALTCAGFMILYNEPMGIANIAAILFFGASASLIFGMLGVIGGVWADKFDQLAAVTNFVITPLTFLSGTFYSISRLPEPFLTITHFNPVFYLIDGFRYGFTGHSDASVTVGVFVSLGLMFVLGLFCYALLRSGYKLKS